MGHLEVQMGHLESQMGHLESQTGHFKVQMGHLESSNGSFGSSNGSFGSSNGSFGKSNGSFGSSNGHFEEEIGDSGGNEVYWRRGSRSKHPREKRLSPAEILRRNPHQASLMYIYLMQNADGMKCVRCGATAMVDGSLMEALRDGDVLFMQRFAIFFWIRVNRVHCSRLKTP
jgi:hypothetical protein